MIIIVDYFLMKFLSVKNWTNTTEMRQQEWDTQISHSAVFCVCSLCFPLAQRLSPVSLFGIPASCLNLLQGYYN